MATPRNQHDPRSRRDGDVPPQPRAEPEQDARERDTSRDVRDDEHDGGYGEGPL